MSVRASYGGLVSLMDDKKTWLWRAWSVRRERICDCGIAYAHNRAEAERVAWMCLGGKWAHSVTEMQVEQVVGPN